jgi:hypothetical protein
MVYADELPLRKRLVAHAAGLLLRIQQKIELLLSQPVNGPGNPVGAVGFEPTASRL